MRRAHLVPHLVHPYSGLLASLLGLASAQARRGGAVELWASAPTLQSGSADAIDQLGPSVPVRRLPGPQSGLRPGRAVSESVAPLEHDVDLVHLHGVFNPMNDAIARALHTPYVVSPHGGYARAAMSYHGIRKRVFLGLVEMPMLRGAALLRALTDSEASDLRRLGYRGPITVVPNGVDLHDSGQDRRSLRAELRLAADVPLAIYAGRIDVRHKRLDAVVRALPAVPWHVAFLGGDFRDGVKTLIRTAQAAGVMDRVHFPSPRRGGLLRDAVGSADAFVLISRSEGMSMALLEAAASGVPAVVSPEVESAMGVARSGAGIVSTPEAVGTALGRVAAAPDSQRQLWADEARRYAAGFEWDTIAARLDDAQRAALTDGQPGSGPK